ncbi:MAG: hypothetical protein COY75_01755 [Nitrospirae bacterium CG_4_10_14_0_8_um_filter_41_23]|nr:hypothetical protein [Nitrospirota bacterium]PIQ95142.1 MAG: hypothetical protein COV68_00805 [Nitrospirae bacterium CG11_big_fil_rev_8_21_14_0_20_41_14]PIW86993.1 MAG: hypothetical protein COZ94_07515 [Nitrospirae bacterium CG_4_8_14_3_um_filter_41_47]PIY87629.1 MAG: hypothetical protein COY75_01755 [Nitrospirae bacterium CG_4_10_14_0_8_um_filter_41_23]
MITNILKKFSATPPLKNINNFCSVEDAALSEAKGKAVRGGMVSFPYIPFFNLWIVFGKIIET